MIKLNVDGRCLSIKEETTLLQACLDNGIYVPNLCFVETMAHPPASCRMCFVEIEGMDGLHTACTVAVKEGMIVKTDTQAVRHLQRTGLQLLLSTHDVDCGHCPANKRCELQRMAAFLKVGLNPKRLDRFTKEAGVEGDHPLLRYDPNRCVLCGKCLYACHERHDKPFMTFAKRGIDTIISFFGYDATDLPCIDCLACVEICPVAAITVKKS